MLETKQSKGNRECAFVGMRLAAQGCGKFSHFTGKEPAAPETHCCSKGRIHVLPKGKTDLLEVHQVQNVWLHILSLLELKKECRYQMQNFGWPNSDHVPKIPGVTWKVSCAHWKKIDLTSALMGASCQERDGGHASFPGGRDQPRQYMRKAVLAPGPTNQPSIKT